MTYRAYITDGLRIITENTAKQSGGSYLAARYAEILEPPAPPAPEDPRDCTDIAADIWTRIKGGDAS